MTGWPACQWRESLCQVEHEEGLGTVSGRLGKPMREPGCLTQPQRGLNPQTKHAQRQNKTKQTAGEGLGGANKDGWAAHAMSGGSDHSNAFR